MRKETQKIITDFSPEETSGQVSDIQSNLVFYIEIKLGK